MKSKRLLALALVFLAGIILIVSFDKTPSLPPVMILPPGPLAVKSGRVPDRWIPAKWTWLRRACVSVLGQPRQILFNVQFKVTTGTVESVVAQNSLGQPLAQSNGAAVWILPDGIPHGPKDSGGTLSASRVVTLDRMEAQVMSGGNAAGYSEDLFARLEKETMDLSTFIIVTADGQTNFAARVRAQLPDGQALFVLDLRHPESATNRIAIVIKANELDVKGNIVQRKPAGK